MTLLAHTAASHITFQRQHMVADKFTVSSRLLYSALCQPYLVNMTVLLGALFHIIVKQLTRS
jgi:hypothetical protein